MREVGQQPSTRRPIALEASTLVLIAINLVLPLLLHLRPAEPAVAIGADGQSYVTGCPAMGPRTMRAKLRRGYDTCMKRQAANPSSYCHKEDKNANRYTDVCSLRCWARAIKKLGGKGPDVGQFEPCS